MSRPSPSASLAGRAEERGRVSDLSTVSGNNLGCRAAGEPGQLRWVCFTAAPVCAAPASAALAAGPAACCGSAVSTATIYRGKSTALPRWKRESLPPLLLNPENTRLPGGSQRQHAPRAPTCGTAHPGHPGTARCSRHTPGGGTRTRLLHQRGSMALHRCCTMALVQEQLPPAEGKDLVQSSLAGRPSSLAALRSGHPQRKHFAISPRPPAAELGSPGRPPAGALVLCSSGFLAEPAERQPQSKGLILPRCQTRSRGLASPPACAPHLPPPALKIPAQGQRLQRGWVLRARAGAAARERALQPLKGQQEHRWIGEGGTTMQ